MKYGKIVAAMAVAGVLCVGGYYAYASTVVSIDEEELYRVVSVVDGDTFKVQVGKHSITVRMLGIDTPETVDPRKQVQCYGLEASGESKRLLGGHAVRLKLNPDREEQDRYERYLAYVYLPDGTFLNEYLLRNGFAREYTFGKAYMFQKEFRAIEREAKKEERGLWGVCEK
ncbi:MAG: thermonuclease family protein [Patescibacteria group bacterium]